MNYPRRLPPPVNLTPDETKAITQSRLQMLDILTNLTGTSATLVLDARTLTPRIRNAVCRNLHKGVILGGGEAAHIAQILSDHFHLGCRRIWGNTVGVNQAWDRETRQQLSDLSAADMATSLLDKPPKWATSGWEEQHRTQAQWRHSCNRYLLGLGPAPRPTLGTYQLSYMNREMLTQASVVAAGGRSPDQQEQAARLIAALKAGRSIQFHYDRGPIVATIV